MEPEAPINRRVDVPGPGGVGIGGGLDRSQINTNVTNNFFFGSTDPGSTPELTPAHGTIATAAASISWPPALANYQPEMANRHTEFESFRALIAGATAKRALFFQAPGNFGKTTLLSECQRYARTALGAEACVLVDFKSTPAKEQALDTLRLNLGKMFPKFACPGSTTGDLRAELYALEHPLVLFFDTHEKASSDASDLLVRLLLDDLDRLPAVRIVVAGQSVPQHLGTLWESAIEPFVLGPIVDMKHWERVTQRRHPNLPASFIQPLALAARGVPGTICTMLQAAADEFRNFNASDNAQGV